MSKVVISRTSICSPQVSSRSPTELDTTVTQTRAVVARMASPSRGTVAQVGGDSVEVDRAALLALGDLGEREPQHCAGSPLREAEAVAATIVTPDDRQFTDLTLAADAEPATALTSTQHHPFWDETTRRWTGASDLQVGDQVRAADGTFLTVQAVRNYETDPQEARNLSLADLHTYYVLAGTTPILVHNARPPRQRPDFNAIDDDGNAYPHSKFMRAGDTGEIKKYAEWGPNVNPRDSRSFDLIKRFDRFGPGHTNADGTVVPTPHINEADGSARPLEDWEKPMGCP
ncbi:polymorphic toxin-type HINT domain-containing protein [Kitasatospora sp. NPDC059817]|uniref:polymorphic toxin-type HINT domain-containing protein n=1 Tax=Kitasatospora sp. NPDC059817 TaxID=3346961 RepID=UPI0036530D21